MATKTVSCSSPNSSTTRGTPSATPTMIAAVTMRPGAMRPALTGSAGRTGR